MFLFTTPNAPAKDAAPASPVVDAIRQGAERTGTRFDYLLATAQRESALDPGARARSSSASGLFQFIEQTWLGLVKSDGPRLGLAQQANAIQTRSDGTHVVSDPSARQAILNLREDPKVASVMAGVFTQRNRETLSHELGREPSGGDLYAAHFLGARGAAQLIETAQQSPSRPAARDFPDAAAANRSIFFDGSGRARGAAEVHKLLSAGHAATAAVTAAPAFAPDRPLAFAAQDGPAFHGLFQTDTRRGPISDAVAKLWRGGERDPGAVRTAALGFFPKTASDATPAAAAAPAAEVAKPVSVDLPLPSLTPSASDAQAAKNGGSRAREPLDLGSFMRWRRR
ncbi:MAG TPA: lytic transglycosylase domain-containing protein [Beijerinckiaceae bacterium]|nr:lytic transglycosylase domain-containing protein [Beijerinckiaceae bacterium]